MHKDKIISQVPFQVVMMKYFETYMHMYGDKKFQEIANNINQSSTVQKVLKWAAGINRQPSAKEYFDEVHMIRYFYFSKAETHITGALVLLGKWKVEVGDAKGLCTDTSLNEIVFALVEKGETIKIIGNDQNSFFKRFRHELETFIQSDEYREIAQQLYIDKPRTNERVIAEPSSHISSYKDTPIDTVKLEALNNLFDIVASNPQFPKLRYALSDYFCGFGHIQTAEWDVSEKEERQWESFNRRYKLSWGTLVLAMVNYTFTDSKAYTTAILHQFSYRTLNGIVALKNEVQKVPVERQFSFDGEGKFEANDDVLFQKYMSIITMLVRELQEEKRYQRYKHICQVFLQLGLLLPQIDKEEDLHQYELVEAVQNTVNALKEAVDMVKFNVA